MPQVSGSFLGKTTSQAMVSLQDTPDHEMSLIEVSGPQNSSDPLWNGATVLYWGAADLVAGTGTQTGYFANRHPNGDIDRGTFEGRITTAAGMTTMEGNWRYSGGTGAFSGITGGGTYKGRITSPTEVQMTWEGTYQLG
jgi:hypothetical protein